MSEEALMQEVALRDMTIEFLEEENMKLNLELNDKEAKIIAQALDNEKLRAAKAELLRLFDEAMDGYADCMPYKGYYLIGKHGDKENFDDLRSAAAALKETGDE